MPFKKLLMVSAILAVAAFGLYGLKELVNSKIEPVQASAPAANQPGALTLVNASAAPDGQTFSAIQIVPAPEIPTRAPDAGGIFSGGEGNILTLQSAFALSDGIQGSVSFGSAVMGTAPDGMPQVGAVIASGPALSIAGEGQGEMLQIEPGAVPAELHGSALIIQGELAPIPAGPDGMPTTITIGPGLPVQVTTQKIMVTEATKLYHDVTPLSALPAAGIQTIHQVLEAGSLDGLTAAQSMVTVWGHLDGEQLVADLIVYQDPLLIK